MGHGVSRHGSQRDPIFGHYGFGFVEMGSNQEAEAAISALDGWHHGGRALTVNEVRPRSRSHIIGRGSTGAEAVGNAEEPGGGLLEAQEASSHRPHVTAGSSSALVPQDWIFGFLFPSGGSAQRQLHLPMRVFLSDPSPEQIEATQTAAMRGSSSRDRLKSGDMHAKTGNVPPTLAIVGDELPHQLSSRRVRFRRDDIFRNHNTLFAIPKHSVTASQVSQGRA